MSRTPLDPGRFLTRRQGLAMLLGWSIVGAAAVRVDASKRPKQYEAPSVDEDVELDLEPGSPIR